MNDTVRLRVIAACLILASLTSCLPATLKEYKGHKIFNPFFLFYLETPLRDRWQKPAEIMKALRLSEGQVIADIGAGGGYFTEKFSRRVGSTGRVFATDVQDIMVRILKSRVQRKRLANVTVIHSTFEDSRVPEGSCDIAFFSSVYKEIENRVAYMKNLQRILKDQGRVAIIEYRIDSDAWGPEIQHRLPEATVIPELEAAGYYLQEWFDFLPREYFLVFGLTQTEPRDHLRH